MNDRYFALALTPNWNTSQHSDKTNMYIMYIKNLAHVWNMLLPLLFKNLNNNCKYHSSINKTYIYIYI